MTYWAIVDDLAAHPKKSLNLLDPVSRGQARAQMQALLGTYAAKGLQQKGSSSLSAVEGTTQDGKTFTVTACVDVTDVDLLDQSGESQVNSNRPDRQRYAYKVQKADDSFFVVEDTLQGKPC